MRKAFFLPLTAALLVAFTSPQGADAQEQAAMPQPETPVVVNFSDVIALQRAHMQLQQQAIVLANLQLTPEESEAFWPLFRTFQNEYEPIGDRIVKLIVDFSLKYDSMSDEEAMAMLKEAQGIQQAETDLKRSYVEKFSAVLPPKKVLRFYQIDNKLRAEIRYGLSLEIPLLETEAEEL